MVDGRVGLGDVRLVVFDVDGTVRAHDDPTCSRAASALDALDAAGIPWTFSTGRPFGSMTQATAALFGRGRPRRACANYNGSVVHVPGPAPVTEVRLMSTRDVAAVLARAERMRMGALVFSCEPDDGLPRETVRLSGFEPDLGRVDAYWPGTREAHDPASGHDRAVTSLVLLNRSIPTAAEVEALQRTLGDGVTASTSGWTSYEVSARGVSKGAALPALAARFGCRPDQVMAMGDGVNDVEMLRAAGVGVAVGNAPPSVRAAADLVTEGHAGDGVSEAVRALLAARR